MNECPRPTRFDKQIFLPVEIHLRVTEGTLRKGRLILYN